MRYVGGVWWEIQLTDGWEADEHPDCLSITRPDGGGAFQVSAAVKTVGAIQPVEVEQQSRQGTPEGAVPKAFIAGSFSGLGVGYVEEDTHWQRFWLADGNVLIFATYNGLPEAWESERVDVYAMLASLRLRSASNGLPI
jgi:hypothetical protein